MYRRRVCRVCVLTERGSFYTTRKVEYHTSLHIFIIFTPPPTQTYFSHSPPCLKVLECSFHRWMSVDRVQFNCCAGTYMSSSSIRTNNTGNIIKIMFYSFTVLSIGFNLKFFELISRALV